LSTTVTRHQLHRIKSVTDVKTLYLTLLIWCIGYAYEYVNHYFKINISDSMPQRLWYVDYGERQLKTNDFVVAKYHDPRFRSGDFEYIIKQVGGVGGEILQVHHLSKPSPIHSTRVGRLLMWYSLNNESYPVYDRLSGSRFTPLTQANLQIPQHCYFVHGLHQPTYDSRYREFGFICESQIEGLAYPIF
jgi:type IV secretory pathway protease TraF